MMSNTYHYSLCIILLIFEDLKGFVRTRKITKFLVHIVTICEKVLGAYRVDTVIMVLCTRYQGESDLLDVTHPNNASKTMQKLAIN